MSEPPSRLRRVLKAVAVDVGLLRRRRDYRLLVGGQFVSLAVAAIDFLTGNVGAIAGPAPAGVLIAFAGIELTYALDAATFRRLAARVGRHGRRAVRRRNGPCRRCCSRRFLSYDARTAPAGAVGAGDGPAPAPR